MTSVLDHGYVRLVETWGSEERIIESARMSTSGAFRGWGPCHKKECPNSSNVYDCNCAEPGDEKLLRYLWEHGHTTPFEMAGMTIEVQLPIFVCRQWQRHRTLSYNELSARYTELPDLFYVPSVERLMAGGQSKSNKQASGEELSLKCAARIRERIEVSAESCMLYYQTMLNDGLSRELARVVLPVNAYTRMRVSGNLLNWTRFLSKRLPADAQWEMRQYAEATGALVAEAFPRTWGLFREGLK